MSGSRSGNSPDTRFPAALPTGGLALPTGGLALPTGGLALRTGGLARLLVGLLLAGVGSVGRGEAPHHTLPAYSQAVALREDATLRAVAFGSGGQGIACGDRGVILRTTDGGESWELEESGLDGTLTSVQWVASNQVVVAGGSLDRITGISRGVVLVSRDGGETWQRADDEELPCLRSLQWDDGLLVARGDWSDSLLTQRFESHDRGQSWHAGSSVSSPSSLDDRSSPSAPYRRNDQFRWAVATQTPIAVRHACRVSDTSLCAVGDHGVILTSQDGGKTWRFARGDQRRTAIMIVARHPSTAPWALIGNEALESRNRVALLYQGLRPDRITDGDDASGAQVIGQHLALQAAVAVGGSGADPIGDLIAADDSADSETIAKQWIAIHRPAVVVLDETLSAPVSDAFFRAAASGGVSRIVSYSFHRSEAGSRGETALHRDALLSKAGVLASDLQTDAMHWLDPLQVDSHSIQLQSLYDSASGVHRGESLMRGIPRFEGHHLSASEPVASRRKLQIAQARMNHSNRMASLLESSRSAIAFSESLGRLLDLTSRDDQFRLAWAAVVKTSQPARNQLDLAFHEVALEQCAQRFADSSAGRWAALRLEVIRNSVEWQRLRTSLPESIATAAEPSAVATVAVSPFQVAGGGIKQVSGISPVVVPKPERVDLKGSGKANGQVEVDLNWEFHPMVLFAREAARLRSDQGTLQATDQPSANLKRLADSEHPWSHLLQTAGTRTLLAARATAPPRLDGVLQDSCWQRSTPANHSGTSVHMAYDEDYLYLAVECPAEQIGSDPIAERPQGNLRDQPLIGVDRLACWLDTDRDLLSAMQLQVSDAGRVHDAIDGQPGWQPTWYPAVRREAERITFEIAILRRDVVDLPVTNGESWFLSAKPAAAGQAAGPTLTPNPDDWFRVIFRP